MSIKRFEDMEVWQASRKLAHAIFSLTQSEGLASDFALKNQIRKSSGSIMDNIAEGFERGGNREFIQFLSIAKGSAGELRSQLTRCLDFGYLTDDVYHNLLNQVSDISKQLSKLISYLKNSELRGSKYNPQEPAVAYSKFDGYPNLDSLNLEHK
jgi:four helix bundle protein